MALPMGRLIECVSFTAVSARALDNGNLKREIDRAMASLSSLESGRASTTTLIDLVRMTDQSVGRMVMEALKAASSGCGKALDAPEMQMLAASGLRAYIAVLMVADARASLRGGSTRADPPAGSLPPLDPVVP
jgi:hypothetical protein